MADMTEAERQEWFKSRRENTNQHAADREVEKWKKMPKVLGEVVAALKGVCNLGQPECWCDLSAVDPRETGHAEYCKAAQIAIKRVEELSK